MIKKSFIFILASSSEMGKLKTENCYLQLCWFDTQPTSNSSQSPRIFMWAEVTLSAYCQARSSVPPKNPLSIYDSKVESFASCRFQIDLSILACMMSREFTCKAVVKFLQGQFS